MLSYTEHGKFRNPTQASDPFLGFAAEAAEKEGSEGAHGPRSPPIFANVPRIKWIMGWPFAQWPIVTGRGAATAIRATFAQ